MPQWPWRRFTSDSSDFVMVVNRWRRGEIGTFFTFFNVKNPRECWKSKRNDSIKQAIDYYGNFWGSQHLLWFEHEASVCEICSTCFDGGTKATAIVSFIGVARSCRFIFQLFRKCNHGRWNLGLWLWSSDQGSEFLMEIIQFSSCKKKRVHQDPTSR